jgi:predicted amidohydrolase YtcJ
MASRAAHDGGRSPARDDDLAGLRGVPRADLGRLAPGCRADFVVLDRALAGLAPAEIAAVRIEEVWFDGARVR